MTTISIATARAGHFEFLATGATPSGAVDALMAAWNTHAARTGADPQYLRRGNARVVTGPVGAAFRVPDFDIDPEGV